MIFKNKQTLKRAIMVLIMLAPILCMGDYVPGIVLARLKRGVVELPAGKTKGDIESIKGNDNLRTYLQNAGLTKIEKVFPKFNSADTTTQLRDGEIVHVHDLSLVFKLSFDPDVNVETITDSLERYTDVIYAELDHIMELSSFPNDPRFGEQWALKQNSDCDIDADSAWGIETGNINIKIGILDNGIEYNHIDLGSGFGPGYKVSGGWDYPSDDSIPEHQLNTTHGTMVSGIASALTHNSYGIAGLTGGNGTDIGCQLFMFKVGLINPNTSFAVQALQEAASPSGYDVDVINCSFGGYTHMEIFRDAISYVYKCRKTIVFSKGNAGSSAPHYPSDYDGHWLISVGATDQYDIRWEYSNYSNGIDVVAPGVDVLTTTVIDAGYFDAGTGTSFAAPHVTGLAALIRSMVWPTIFLYPEDVEGIIRATAYDPPWSDPGYDDLYGAGRINAYYALKYLGYRQALSRSAVTPTDCIFTGYYQKTFIGVSGLDDGTYNVQRFGFYRDVWLPADTLKFHGIWGRGRTTDGYSDGDPNYGEGYCNVSEIPGLPGCYRVSSYIYKVWDLDWIFEGWFPIEPNHPTAPSNVFLAYTVFSTKFFPPHGPYADNITETSLTLHWSYYYPELIDGYTVKRDGQVIGNPPNNQLYWDDSGLEPGHLYHYEILARKGSVYSSPAILDVSTQPSGMLAQSDYAKMSAFNSNCKVVRGSDGKIHIVYNDVDNIYYNYSTDGGISFGNWEAIPKHELPGQYYGYDTIPAFCLDEDGVPWIVSAVHFFPNWNDKWLEYYLHKRTTEGWRLSYDEVWQKKFIASQPSDVLHPPSFVVVGDSGYIVFREPAGYGEVFVSSFPIGLNTDYTVTQLAPYGLYPSITYDEAGRLVVLVHESDWGSIRLYYRTLGPGNWESVLIPDCEAYGSPSLWAGTNEIKITFEGYNYNTNQYGLIFLRVPWSGTTYAPQTPEIITVNVDCSANGIEGYSSFASKDVVLWKYQDDIYYSTRDPGYWTEPVNISESPGVSSYPQGVVFGGGLRRKLFTLWTEQSGSDYYLIRKMINLPQVYPYIDVALSDIPQATGYNNSQRLLRDASGGLHLAFTKGDHIYHSSLYDTSWTEPVLVGTGKYPSLSLGSDDRLYSIYAYNEGSPDFLEEVRTSRFDGNTWSMFTPLMHTYGTYFWGVGAPSFVADDSIGYFIFETSYGSTYHPAPGDTMPMIITFRGYALIYGEFPLASPKDGQWQVLDSVPLHAIPVPIDTTIYEDSVVAKLISPSITLDPEAVVHVLWEGFGDSLYYYRIEDTAITKQTSHGVMIDYPLITMREDQIDHFWCEQSQIKHRYAWTGIEALSEIETIAECESPFSSGPYLTWTKQDGILSHLYYGEIPGSGMIEPVEIEYSFDLIAYPQILYNPEKSNEPASIDLVWTDYDYLASIGYIYHLNLPIEEPAPTYAFNMGTETPVPVIVQRDGYLTLGPGNFQTLDYDSTELIYHMTLHSPHKKYKIRWTYYHEESDKLKLQFNIDDILHHNHWVEPGEIVTEDAWIPQACLNDNEITIKVKRLKGMIAVLSGLEIEIHEVGGGGPQSAGVQPIKRFFFESMYPNPTKGLLKIRFNSPDERKVTVKMYDVVGRLAETIFDGKAKIGINEFLIMPKELSAGVYFIRLETSGYEKTEKIILLQ